MKGNIAEEITNRILEDLEKGVLPWEKPWKQGRGLPLPVNASTGNATGGSTSLSFGANRRSGGFLPPPGSPSTRPRP